MSATKQINCRIPVELHDRLAAHKDATGEEKSEVIRRGIELALGEPPAPEASSPPPMAPAAPETSPASDAGEEEEAASIDFARWLSGRTGIPRALARLRIVAGHVAINGERYQEETVPAALLGNAVVSLDGKPV